jgi:hypothetical protein
MKPKNSIGHKEQFTLNPKDGIVSMYKQLIDEPQKSLVNGSHSPASVSRNSHLDTQLQDPHNAENQLLNKLFASMNKDNIKECKKAPIQHVIVEDLDTKSTQHEDSMDSDSAAENHVHMTAQFKKSDSSCSDMSSIPKRLFTNNDFQDHQEFSFADAMNQSLASASVIMIAASGDQHEPEFDIKRVSILEPEIIGTFGKQYSLSSINEETTQQSELDTSLNECIKIEGKVTTLLKAKPKKPEEKKLSVIDTPKKYDERKMNVIDTPKKSEDRKANMMETPKKTSTRAIEDSRKTPKSPKSSSRTPPKSQFAPPENSEKNEIKKKITESAKKTQSPADNKPTSAEDKRRQVIENYLQGYLKLEKKMLFGSNNTSMATPVGVSSPEEVSLQRTESSNTSHNDSNMLSGLSPSYDPNTPERKAEEELLNKMRKKNKTLLNPGANQAEQYLHAKAESKTNSKPQMRHSDVSRGHDNDTSFNFDETPRVSKLSVRLKRSAIEEPPEEPGFFGKVFGIFGCAKPRSDIKKKD